MKLRRLIILSMTFLILYQFVFSREIPEQTSFLARKAIDLNQTLPLSFNNLVQEEAIPFVLGEHYGYLNAHFSSIYSNSSTVLPAIAPTGYLFPVFPDEEILWNEIDGTPKKSLEISGSPFFEGNDLYLLGSMRRALYRIDETGARKWQVVTDSMITCLASSSYGVLIGLLNGKVLLANKEGQIVWEFSPGGSETLTIFGVALSPNGERIALVSGLNPQRFIVLEKRREDFKPVFHQDLETDYRRPVRLSFSPDSQYCLREEPGSMKIVSMRDFTTLSLTREAMQYSDFINNESYYGFLFTEEGFADLTLSEIHLPTLFHARFPADNTLLKILDTGFILGIDETLLLIEQESL